VTHAHRHHQPRHRQGRADLDEISDEEVERILAWPASTFRTYRTTTFAERGGWMVRAAEILETRPTGSPP